MEAVIAALPAFGAGWFAVRWQHLLYREAAFREAPAAGQKAVLLRGGAGVAVAGVCLAAFWPGRFDPTHAWLTAIFGLVFIVLAATDFDRKRIPDRLSFPAMALALAVSPFWEDRGLLDAVYGGLAGFGAGAVFFGFGLLMGPSGGLGLGDAKLMGLIGLVVGWPGAVTAIFLGILLAGIPSVVLLFRGKGKTGFAYGPYLAAGAVAALLFPSNFG